MSPGMHGVLESRNIHRELHAAPIWRASHPDELKNFKGVALIADSQEDGREMIVHEHQQQPVVVLKYGLVSSHDSRYVVFRAAKVIIQI